VAFFAGDVDMVDAMKAYSKIGFTGAMQPDHTPLMALPEGSERAAWHVGKPLRSGT
jgi:D-mannonate dehydratase